MDKYFRVEVLGATPNPQQIIYAAMHQDYSEEFVYDELNGQVSETRAGEIAVERLLKGGRGHYGCLEHPQIILNAGWFPHSVMQQLRTHRVGISMDVQSGRYTGRRIIDVVTGERDDVEEVFYLRPVGEYTDRQGKKYFYSSEWREKHLRRIRESAIDYTLDVAHGMSEEHARGTSPFDIRQHWVISLNCRSFLHICDLRGKKDAQLEIQQFVELAWVHFEKWVPKIAAWYKENRMGKAKLSP